MKDHVNSLQHAKIFGAEISQTFLRANGVGSTNVKIVAVVLIILMTSTMFITQLQLMRKNMPKEALEGQAAQMQKIMLYVFPVFFLIGGFNFPIGVLIYWFVSNVWTMGQQFYVIRRNPAPGTPAYDAMEARKREHNRRAGRPADEGLAGAEGEDGSVATDRRPANRQQPKRQSRSTRKTVAPSASTGSTPADDAPEAKPSSNGQQAAPATDSRATGRRREEGRRQADLGLQRQASAGRQVAGRTPGSPEEGRAEEARRWLVRPFLTPNG